MKLYIKKKYTVSVQKIVSYRILVFKCVIKQYFKLIRLVVSTNNDNICSIAIFYLVGVLKVGTFGKLCIFGSLRIRIFSTSLF